MTAQEKFLKGVYASVDEAAACELDRLRRDEGIIPTCKAGCCYCCRYHVLITPIEAHGLAHYIRQEFSADQTNDLRMRTQEWHRWDSARPGRPSSSPSVKPAAGPINDPCCPLLVKGLCSAYPMRPDVCRTHYVHSHPLYCCEASNPDSTEAPPVPLTTVVTAARPYSSAIPDQIEGAGLDLSRSIMLLPHWLGIVMGWEFGCTDSPSRGFKR
ncbi:YkgJ family cysteine cluster protein [Desulfoluna sp.]|uniref:YkgJ family cysteine cluster protein n=1 Tax=Desulfoluna sp. TaxID=2045199 RepID=UPI002635FE00|nr:YkgJ family cysteine cluster protein [Desulfoluna sp.]